MIILRMQLGVQIVDSKIEIDTFMSFYTYDLQLGGQLHTLHRHFHRYYFSKQPILLIGSNKANNQYITHIKHFHT